MNNCYQDAVPHLTTRQTYAVSATRAFISNIYTLVHRSVADAQDLRSTYQQAMQQLRPVYGHWVIFDHGMPFNIAHAYDEASGHEHPRIWTAQRDLGRVVTKSTT